MYKFKEDLMKVPAYVWSEEGSIEDNTLKQLRNSATLPFAFHHVVLCPDGHLGYGAPIGGILASEDYIIPNFVGQDIGCGMGFVHTNIPANLLKSTNTPSGELRQQIVGNIMRIIPLGFSHHKDPQTCKSLTNFTGKIVEIPQELMKEIESGYYQLGTLGGGKIDCLQAKRII